MRSARYRPRASYDLESIVVYIGEVQRAPKSAKRLYESIVEAVNLLCELPTIGHPFIDDALEREEYRWHLVGQYRIFYTFDSEHVTVYRIVHTRQEIADYAFVNWD